MAARIMIEDCLALLLDVQDVDRLFAASPSVCWIHVALQRLALVPVNVLQMHTFEAAEQ